MSDLEKILKENPCALCLNGMCEDCCENCLERFKDFEEWEIEWIKKEDEWERRVLR